MKKQGIAAALLLLSLVAGCGGGSPSTRPADPSVSDTDIGWTEDTNGESVGTDAAPPASAVRQNAKLILRADLSLQTQTFAETSALIEDLTAKAGGYLESSDTSGEVGSRWCQYVVRVPQTAFESFLQQVGDSCHVVQSSQSASDVSDHYTDLEIRLQTLRTKHARLLNLLEKAERMEDIIALESALSDTQYEIDSVSGEKRQYDSLVDFATISLDVQEMQILASVSESAAFGAQLKHSAVSGWNGLTGFVQGILLLAVSLWPLLLIVLIVVLIVRRNIRRHASKPKTMSAPPTAPYTPVPPYMPPAPTESDAPAQTLPSDDSETQ